MDNNLLTKQEVAGMLRVSTETISEYARTGKLKFIAINSRGDRRFKPEDIENFLKEAK